jgi:NAD(P)-dependent dehydrogenase (short-subunit alcohol dehydrogenase family)
VAALVDRAVVRFGQIDGLVNVVGGGMAGRKAPDVSRSNWDQVLSLSLTSTFLMCREVIPHLERQGGGAIVNVSSMAAIRGMHESPAYCAAKGGVIGLTRALALDHGSAGIRVNCVAPGAVATPALRRTRTREQVAALGAGALVGRVAEPHEIASVIHWLLSDYASYMMGKVLEVDGGLPTLA